jgi:hypothetical protein
VRIMSHEKQHEFTFFLPSEKALDARESVNATDVDLASLHLHSARRIQIGPNGVISEEEGFQVSGSGDMGDIEALTQALGEKKVIGNSAVTGVIVTPDEE